MLFNLRCYRKDLSYRVSRHLKSLKISGSGHNDSRRGKYVETAEKLNIEIIPLGFGLYELKKNDVIAIGIGYDKQNVVTNMICKNKYLNYKVLERKGINCFPRHQYYTFKDFRKTYEDFENWNCPVVIKPCSDTYGGQGVTVNIKTVKDLKNAIAQSFIFDRDGYLMEEYIKGSHFRVLTLKGDFVSCCQRVPARIIGNGRDSIKKLIEKENQRRKAHKSETILYPIKVDNEVKRKIRSLNKSANSVLEKDEEFFVKDVVNLHSGGEILHIENVSEEIKSLCKKIANMLDIYLAGFDIITSDISRPFSETDGVINEINSTPDIDFMYKVINHGTRVDAIEIVLKDVFNL